MRFSNKRVFLSVGLALVMLCRSTEARPQISSWVVLPGFETISVKSGDSNGRGSLVVAQGGRFTATDVTLKQLLRFAYDLQDFQIPAGPNWMDSAKFTIEATPPSTVQIPYDREGMSTVVLMVQSLLADRFKLAMHLVTHDDELVVNKGGHKLKEASNNLGGQVRIASGQLIGTAAPMSLLVGELSRYLGVVVVDKTSLAGTYDFNVSWTPLSGATAPPADLPSIFTTMKELGLRPAMEELGLRLQAAKDPVNRLVIDHVEIPDSN